MNRVPNLLKLFIDLLSSINVGRGVWKRFGIDMLDRFISNNLNNYWDNDIVNLTAIMTPFKNDASTDETDKAINKGITISKNIIIGQFKTLAHDWHDKVVYLFKKDSAIYVEFYPHKLTYIDHITLIDIGVAMNNLIDAADKYEPQLGVGFSAPMKAILTNFHTISETHTIQKSKIDDDKIDLDNDVINLRGYTTKLICGVAYHYHGEPNKLNVYFDLSILKSYGHHKSKDGDIYNDAIAANTTIIISNKIKKDNIITFKVEGTVALTFSLSTIDDGTIGTGYTINPGDELVIDLSEQENPKIPYLKCTNPSTDTVGEYWVEVK